MKQLSQLAAALAASFALLPHGFVMAAGVASASISNVQFGILDLTPNDGIAAAYEIDNFSVRHYASLRSGTENLMTYISPDAHQPVSTGYERGPSYVWATTGGTIGELAANVAAHANFGGSASLMATTLQEISLTLRPYSVLTVGGHFSFLGGRAEEDGMDFSANGQTTAYLEADGDGRYSAGRAFWVYPGGPISDAWDEDFMLTYGNNSNHDLQLSLSFYTQASADVFPAAPAIPEPGAWSMLGAGLAVVGVAASRRRRSQMHERAT